MNCQATITVVFGLLASMLAGCQSENLSVTTAQEAYRSLQATAFAVQTKIDAENKYYDDIAALVRESYRENRTDDLDNALSRHATNFYVEHRDNVNKVDADDLSKLLMTAAGSWAKRDAERRMALTTALDRMRKNRQKLEHAKNEIETLSSQLAVLSRAQNKEKLLRFFAGYAKSAKEEYDKLKKEVINTAEAKPLPPGVDMTR